MYDYGVSKCNLMPGLTVMTIRRELKEQRPEVLVAPQRPHSQFGVHGGKAERTELVAQRPS